MSQFLTARTAANLLLIVALAIQPIAALCGGGPCPASGGVGSASPEQDCCKTDAPRCCGGGQPKAAESRAGSCCGHASSAAASPQKVASGPTALDRTCSCGHHGQPLSDSTSRSNTDGKRIDGRVAFAMFIAADDARRDSEAGRVGIGQPASPEHFTQRNLCIWRL